ncbi:LysR family transcriptional regulator [Shewanella submarina]|uniref:LysR family transcriptional regulator n=1 Tax=Shewanella submarina TaxID=2016376 RepID=A0ABV7G8U7_9GAMM|nr:LysR family transcriptional regulator [Shewanella submarina]MCL1038467.1 LysR family transcriptional regulator [Shewanella submarina]
MDISKIQLNINHLKMICTIAKSETVKEAAESLFITQPALSNRIREAERRLDTVLFVRRGRKLIISNAGKRLLHSAQKILDELGRAEYDIARLSDGIEQVLRLGLPQYASFKWLPAVTRYFASDLPHIELEITAASQPLNALFNGDVDIAMISSAQKSLSLDDNLYESSFLLQDELMACLSQDHEKANRQYLLAEDFSDETYITNSIIPEKDREYELFFQPENILPRKVLQVGFNEAIIELVKVNYGITIMSKHLMSPYLESGAIMAVPLGEKGLNIYWHLVYLKQSKIARPAKQLSAILQQYARG